MKLLLTEDEVLLSAAIAKGLRKRGYAVDCAYDGEEALELYSINEYDLMILDLNLPKIDGLEVLRRIREQDSVLRILILSARSSVPDKIAGLDGGSNDYLTKPFDFAELEARIRALLRQEFYMKDVNLYCGSLRIDTAARRVYWKDTPVELANKEYSILEYLMSNQGKVISPEELIEHVWDSERDPFSNSFRFHISSLRKKLSAVSGTDSLILTLRGQGYRMADEGALL
ncbi:response regulator transcription factor [Blautia schinkii]|nr:response regulator transcription factor [Blautia schinkii]